MFLSEVIYLTDDVLTISSKMNIPAYKVRKVLSGYTDYIVEKLKKGESVGFLRISNFLVRGYEGVFDTFMYSCHELSKKVDMSVNLVKSILLYYESLIVIDLKKFRRHSIYRVMSLKLEEYGNGNIVVTAKKSSYMPKKDIVSMRVRKSFKRKVEVIHDGKDS